MQFEDPATPRASSPEVFGQDIEAARSILSRHATPDRKLELEWEALIGAHARRLAALETAPGATFRIIIDDLIFDLQVLEFELRRWMLHH